MNGMENRKKKAVIRQTLSAIAIIFIAVSLLIVIIFPKLLNRDVENYLNQNVLHTAKIVKSALDTSVNSKKTIERLIDDKLYIASIEIAKELNGKKINEITQKELINIRDKLGLYDISLLIRKNDDIVIAQSSDPMEVGLSTKDWGYWYTGFDQLMSGKTVTVGKGYYRKNYWSGPISKSEIEDKYFKYAYYFDGTTDYMINPYIEDKEIYTIIDDSGPESLINSIAHTSDLEEIAVINVGAMTNGAKEEIIEPEEDLPVLYGKYTFNHEEDFEYLHKVLRDQEMVNIDMKKEGVKYKKFYLPVSEDRVMVIVTNLHRQEVLMEKFMLFFLSAFIFAFIIIFIVLQQVTRKYLKPLETINDHINQISTGDLTNKIHIMKDNEWGEISGYLNKMTDDFNELISQIKKRIDSVMLVSSMLSKTVNSYFKTMDKISSTMTQESRELFHEIDLRVGDIQKNYKNLLQEMENAERNKDHEYFAHCNFIVESSKEIIELNQLMKKNIESITEMSFSSYDAIEDLTSMILQLDSVSKDLENQIKIFKVNEEGNK